jgi:hypothetical protein
MSTITVIFDVHALVNVDVSGLYGIRFRIGPFEGPINIKTPALPEASYLPQMLSIRIQRECRCSEFPGGFADHVLDSLAIRLVFDISRAGDFHTDSIVGGFADDGSDFFAAFGD